MKPALRRALPMCRYCSGPCHPVTMYQVTDQVPSDDPADIPDEYEDPPEDNFLGSYCSEACLNSKFLELREELMGKPPEGPMPWDEVFEDDDEDSWD